jgi:3alpha(or 20beta)-hydroxysteroid dehydrogenase
MSGRVEDRVIVVTGAARGQGATEVAALHAEGAVVIAADIEGAAGNAPDRVHQRRLDVTSPEDWAGLAAWLRDRFGKLDGLVNNAGTTSRVALAEVPLEGLYRDADDGVRPGRVQGRQRGAHAARARRHAGGGCRPDGLPDVRRELLPVRGRYSGRRRLLELRLGQGALRRGAPMRLADIVAAAVFLASDEAAYITGANLVIDGDWSLVLPGFHVAGVARLEPEWHREETEER